MIRELHLFDDLKVKVHSNGQIETFDRCKPKSNGVMDTRKGRILKPKIDKYGYEVVTLTTNGKRKCYRVHRLVAMAFIDNPENKPTVNHIDGNKRNNDYFNLEWATQKEQKLHSIVNGLCTKNILALKEVSEKQSIPIMFEGVVYPSIRAAARQTGISQKTVKKRGKLM